MKNERGQVMIQARSNLFIDEENIFHYCDISGILIIVLDKEGKIRSINRKLCEILEYDRQEIEGFEWVDKFVHPDDRDLFRSVFNDLLSGKSDDYEAIEGRILTKSGGYRTVSWASHATVDDEGEVLEIISLGVDIKEKTDLETGFILKNKAIETSINGIIISDMDANIIYSNPSFARMHGYDSINEVLAMNATEFFCDPDEMKNMFQEIMATGKFQGETVIRKKSGDIIIDQASVNLIRPEESDESYMVVSMVDVTEKVKVKDALENVNKRLNILSSVTRHDILNEVMVASGYLELIPGASPAQKEEYISKAAIAVSQIRKEAEFTRDYQDMGVSPPVWQDIRKIIETHTALGMMYDCIDVKMDIRDIEIYADPMLPKVFANIMNNSLIHGEHVTEIAVSASESKSGELRIVIEDNGIGISPEKKRTLFKPGRDPNHGFGLYLVKEILSITDIEITEDGEPGRGARFEITVPRDNWRKA